MASLDVFGREIDDLEANLASATKYYCRRKSLLIGAVNPDELDTYNDIIEEIESKTHIGDNGKEPLFQYIKDAADLCLIRNNLSKKLIQLAQLRRAVLMAQQALDDEKM